MGGSNQKHTHIPSLLCGLGQMSGFHQFLGGKRVMNIISRRKKLPELKPWVSAKLSDLEQINHRFCASVSFTSEMCLVMVLTPFWPLY